VGHGRGADGNALGIWSAALAAERKIQKLTNE
jgi:hypothetical protein